MKTKVILFLFILFSFVKLGTIKPSEDIWEKVKSYWQQGLMYNESAFYFVFDEYNYTKFDLSSKEMLELKEKQEELYKSYNIRNYIFAVKTLDTSIESIEKAADSLSTFIEKDFKIDMSNSVIALIVMDLQKVRIRTGSSINNKITDTEAQKIISNMGTNMRTKNYYKAFYNIITDIKTYYENEESSGTSASSIIIIILFVLGFIGICCLCCYCQRKGYCESSGSSYYSYSSGPSHHHHGGGHRSGGGHHGGGGGGGHSGGASGGW